MNILFKLFSLAIGVLPVDIAAVAQVCTPSSGDGYAYNVTSQSSLDLLAQNCTTINGSIVIANNFSGSFYLPNIQNVTGEIRQNISSYVSSPTSIELRDLEYGGSIYFYMPTLANMSIPKLKTAQYIEMDYVQQVNLASLESANFVSITGNLSSLQLDSLQNLESVLTICNMDGCEQNEYPTDALDISLSALQSAEAISINGTVASLAVPNLTHISSSTLGASGIMFISNAVPVNLSFPLLNTTLDTLSLEGNISSISMPRMLNLSNTWFSVDASAPLKIDLPVREAALIQLTGSIKSVKFPNLTSLAQFSVNSTLPLDCRSLEKTIQQQTNTSAAYITCTSAAPKHSAILKVVIGVVVGVVAAIVI